MTLNAKLVVVGGDTKTTEIKLNLPTTIGRGRGTPIILPHPLVSRQHCELFEADGQLMVRDLGSLNGTFVNNERITESPLAPDELLTVGTVTFRAVYEAKSTSPTDASAQTKRDQSEKTVQGLKGTTFAAQPKNKQPNRKQPEPEPQPAPDSGVLEFDFGEPLTSGDEINVTERMETKAAGKNPPKSKPAPSKSPPAKKPAAKDDSSNEVDDADEEEADSSSDDDLGDFLDSLNKK